MKDKKAKVSICTKNGFKVFVNGVLNEELTNKYKPKTSCREFISGQSTMLGFAPEYLERGTIEYL